MKIAGDILVTRTLGMPGEGKVVPFGYSMIFSPGFSS